VIGFADVIAGEMFGPVGTERYREYAKLIRMSGAHLLDIISDILDLAKIEANHVVLDEKPVDVGGVMAMCETLVSSRAEQAGVTVQRRMPASLPSLQADELRVKQIVLNLLSNAVKFSPRGAEVVLGASLGRDGGIEIEVKDRGCGMNEEELRLALQPFRQVNSAIAKQAEGTGLGLPLALRLTMLHGGRLDIESAPGVGTTARVRFPPSRTLAARSAA
jgi:two-component system cell cycle sensor histidine kinase PleC